MKESVSEPAPRTKSLWRDPVVLAAAGTALLQIGVIWHSAVPLGVPGEWTWQRVPLEGGAGAAALLGTIAAVPIAAVYLLFVWWADPGRRPTATPRWIGLRLAALAAAGFAWLWAAQEAGPLEFNRLGRAPLVLFYRAHSGYFTEARRIDDLSAYLASYESLMAEGDVLHIGTHPPGLTVAHRLLLDAFEASPTLTRRTLAACPESVRVMSEVIVETHRSDAPGGVAGGPPSDAEQAELWAAAVLVQIAAAAAVIPLFYLANRSSSRGTAWRTACLWPLVPAVAVFLPKADAMLPLFGLATLALWHRPGPPAPGRAAAAGAVFWLGLTVSLAMLPVAALCGALSLAHAARQAAGPARRNAIVATLKSAAVAGAAFIGLTLLVLAAFDLNLLSVWSWNYRNHAGFYSQYSRTYWLWLLVNPLELAFSVGLPIVVAASASVRRFSESSSAVPVLAVILLLWLSGKNSSEAARLWLFLMPWVVWLTEETWAGAEGRRRWAVILPLQMIVGFATAVRVGGFGLNAFAEFAG